MHSSLLLLSLPADLDDTLLLGLIDFSLLLLPALLFGLAEVWLVSLLPTLLLGLAVGWLELLLPALLLGLVVGWLEPLLFSRESLVAFPADWFVLGLVDWAGCDEALDPDLEDNAESLVFEECIFEDDLSEVGEFFLVGSCDGGITCFLSLL